MIKTSKLISCAAFTLIATSSTLTPQTQAQAQNTQAPSVTPVIRSYRPDVPYQVNTYWFETKRGVVVMDFQRKLSLASGVLKQVQATRKPVVGLLVTHPHTDHIAGLGLFAQAFPNAPIYASAGTIEEMSRDTQGYIKLTQELIGSDYPTSIEIPNRIIRVGETLDLDGVVLQTREMGESESKASTVFYLPSRQALFTGDLVTNSTDAFLLEGGSGAWIRQLDELARCYPQAKTLYPGHGKAGAPAILIARQRLYLTTFRFLVLEQMGKGQWNGETMSEPAKNIIRDAMKKRFPTFVLAAPIPDIVRMSVDPVAKELAQERVGYTK